MKRFSMSLGTILLAAMPAIGHAQTSADAPRPDNGVPAASARLSCDALKQKVTAKLTEHGVKQFTLDVADEANPGAGKVVGHCDGGKRVVTYTKGSASEVKQDAGK